MRLPNVHLALIEREKITGYLLDSTHPFGASKARFFERFGFEPAHWMILADALRDHARDNEVCSHEETGFGPRFEVDGPLVSPDRRNPWVRTVWQVEEGTLAPRLITAYPLEVP